ncbi:MAG: hypothetical protein ACLFTQ_01335 [Candidatus Aenigmatarchaeota archaeon]
MEIEEDKVERNKSLYGIFKENASYESGASARLFLGELGMGTKVYDERAMEGLSTYLEENDYKEEVDQVVIAGGLFPEFPFLYSKNNAERMRFLGQDEEVAKNETEERVSEIIEAITSEETAEHYEEFEEKWIEGKLSSWQMVKEHTSRQLEILFENLDPERVDYCQGDEDRFNRKEREEIQVNKLAEKAREYRDELEEEMEQINEAYEEEEAELEEEEIKYDALKKMNNKLSGHMTADEPEPNEFLDFLIETESDKIFEEVGLGGEGDFTERISGIEEVEEFRNIYETVKDKVEEKREKIKELKGEKRPLEDRRHALERELEQGRTITRYTRRSYLSPKEAEWIYKKTKDDYTNDIFECFPDEVEDITEPHISRNATIENVSYGEGDEDVLDEAEVGIYDDVLVMQSTKFRSDTTTLKSLEEGEEEVLYRRLISKVRNEAEDSVPELLLTPHGAGGFDVKRINTTPEYKELGGEERDAPEVSTIMPLPTFQSVDKLLEFKDKGIRNWNTKRIDKHMHASGAVIQTVLEDGSEMTEYIDHSSLVDIAEKKKELEKYEEGSEEYEEVKGEIEKMCSKTPKVRAGLFDAHLGSANVPGTPSNYERAERTKNYLKEVYGDFVDELLFSELIHGVLEHTGTEQRVYSEPLPQIRKKNKEDLRKLTDEEAEELTQEDYAEVIEDIDRRYKEALEQISWPNRSKQFDIAEHYVKELVEGTDPEKVINISGNHDRSDEGVDEATTLERIIKGFDWEGEIINSSAFGSKHGGYGGIKDEKVIIDGEEMSTGKSVGFHHKIPGGRTSNTRTKRKMLRSGYMFDELFAGHVHQPRVSFTSGTAITIFPGQEGLSEYVEHLPVNPAVYGTTVKYSNAAPEDHPANDIIWHGWHFVNDETLEREEYKGDEFDEELELLFEEE